MARPKGSKNKANKAPKKSKKRRTIMDDIRDPIKKGRPSKQITEADDEEKSSSQQWPKTNKEKDGHTYFIYKRPKDNKKSEYDLVAYTEYPHGVKFLENYTKKKNQGSDILVIKQKTVFKNISIPQKKRLTKKSA